MQSLLEVADLGLETQVDQNNNMFLGAVALVPMGLGSNQYIVYLSSVSRSPLVIFLKL